jgi:hypothetical protein
MVPRTICTAALLTARAAAAGLMQIGDDPAHRSW